MEVVGSFPFAVVFFGHVTWVFAVGLFHVFEIFWVAVLHLSFGDFVTVGEVFLGFVDEFSELGLSE